MAGMNVERDIWNHLMEVMDRLEKVETEAKRTAPARYHTDKGTGNESCGFRKTQCDSAGRNRSAEAQR